MSLLKPRDEAALIWTLRICAVLASGIVFSIFVYLCREALLILRTVPLANIMTARSWNPTEGLYNLAPMLLASILSTLLALALAGPFGILSAIYSQLYAVPSTKKIYRAFVEVLAGIPSVVYGFWGLTVLVPCINRWHPPGASLLAASLILALMILPSIALLAEVSFASVPAENIRGAHALGLSRLGIFHCVILPHSRGGLFAALLLASGRALGETMAMIMVCGNVVQIPGSIFDPVRTLTANIALEMAYATGTHRSALFLSGLLLILLVILLMGTARLFTYRGRHAV